MRYMRTNITIKRKQRKTAAVLYMGAVLLLSACDVKDPIYNTAHPEQGQIILTTDWTHRTDGVGIPDSYTITVGPYTETATETALTLDNLFEPGEYRIRIYNLPQHVGLMGDALLVEPAMPPEGIDERFIQPMPGWLFSSTLWLDVMADTDHQVSAMMRQQVRQLTLFIEPKGGALDRIKRIEGYLSGVASMMDIYTEKLTEPANVALSFARVTDGDNAGKWAATVRLLGVAGTRQTLHATVFFEDDNPRPVPLTDADGNEGSDLTKALAGFNADKIHPLALGGKVVETPTSSGFNATIRAWELQENVTGDADLQ
jgi:hypothetical protein